MEVISSGQTFFIKRVFPVLWCVMVGGLLVAAAIGGQGFGESTGILALVVMLVVGIVLFRKLLGNLADEVRDGGDVLLVRLRGVEQRVPLANVMNVSMGQFANPRRITLRLRSPGPLGDEITFIPKTPFQLNPFARNPIAERLLSRIDSIRNRA